MISIVVLTKNEEKNIEECLETLKWADEIVVVDDNSTDKTVEKVKSLKLKVQIYERSLDGDFSAQRNFALEKAKGEWVLFVDTDERVSPELAKEIQAAVRSQEHKDGYYLLRKDLMWGTWLKHSDLPRQEERRGLTRILRLGKKTAGKWVRPVHEVWEIPGEIGELENPLEHFPHPTISEFLEEINFYSTIRAKELYDQGTRTNLFEILAYPAGKFLKSYILRQGFLDGMPGFAVILLMSFHSFLVKSKLYLLVKSKGQ